MAGVAQTRRVDGKDVKGGDLEGTSFETLYRDHVALVAHIARQRLHSEDAVADVVQEVFVRALRALPRLREPDAFGPWVAAITRHVVADLGRAPHDAPLEIDLASTAPGPEHHAEVAETVRQVLQGQRRLSTRDMTIIDLLSLGFGPREVAGALHISAGAAKVAIHRARTRLRAQVGADGSGGPEDH